MLRLKYFLGDKQKVKDKKFVLYDHKDSSHIAFSPDNNNTYQAMNLEYRVGIPNFEICEGPKKGEGIS